MEDDLIEKITQIVINWNTLRGTRRVFGSYHLYTKQAHKKLYDILQQTLSLTGILTVLKIKHDLAMLGKDWIIEGKTLQPMSIFEDILSIKEDFERLQIHSITFVEGLEKEELVKLFDGLSKSPIYLGSAGLVGFLKNSGVSHIEIDKLKFKLSKEGEESILSWYTPEGKEVTRKLKIFHRI
jgi:hypothetical protein